MKTFIKYLKTALKAEHIKKRGTGIYVLSCIIGAISPIILYIARLQGSTRFIPRSVHNMYLNYIENSLELFAYYFLPFLIILVASRITFLDHKNSGWQLMETLPVQKYVNYFSKFIILLVSNGIAILTFAFLNFLFTFILSKSSKTGTNLGTCRETRSFTFATVCK